MFRVRRLTKTGMRQYDVASKHDGQPSMQPLKGWVQVQTWELPHQSANKKGGNRQYQRVRCWHQLKRKRSLKGYYRSRQNQQQAEF